MSKGRNRQKKTGTDKQMLAAMETPAAMHDAEQPAAVGALHDMSSTTRSGATGLASVAESDGGDEIPAQTASVASMVSELPAAVEPDPAIATAALDSAAKTAPPAPAALRIETVGHAAHGSVGQRLRAAREVRGWSIEEVGTRLHIPVQIIRALEAEQFDKIGYGVYLRGYLTSYARLVDVPTILVDNVVRERSQTPPLVASGTISHSRYLYQRYSVSALYLILTGVIIVPAVLLAMRASLQPGVNQLTALDAPAASAAAEAATPNAAKDPANGQPAAAAPANGDAAASPPSEAPLVASLAPFSALSHKDAAHAETTGATAPAVAAALPAGTHTLKLTLKEASWVQVVSASGEKLEYGLLAAGTTRSYTSDKALDVRLGNCNGAEVETDGQLQDLAPYRHSNIAHFKLFAAGEPISRTDQ